MKTLLLPFYDDDVSQSAFAASAQLARQVNGYVEGLFVIRRPEILDGDGHMLADSHFTQFMDECRRVADRARTRFESCAAEHGLPVTSVGTTGAASVGWHEVEGMDQQVVGSHGRLFDAIIVGRQFGHPWLNWRTIVEAALFESGRPVIVVPSKAPRTFGENVVIAWNSSTETARTVAFATPLLARARTVTVLCVEGWGVPGPEGDELAAYLARAGVHATPRTIEPNGRSAGEAVLQECARIGADLLVKGAYTQSRLRQLIFGGATRHILAQAQLPVILSN
jgi:nucleotide-binding universal stress UspA family protein